MVILKLRIDQSWSPIAGETAELARRDHPGRGKSLGRAQEFDCFHALRAILNITVPFQRLHSMARKEQRLKDMLVRAKAEVLAGEHFRTPEYLALLLDRELDGLIRSLEQAEVKREIFSIVHQGQVLYPDYAFSDNQEGNLLPGLVEIIEILSPKNDDWGMAFWFRSPNNFLGGKRPEDTLHQEFDKVVAAAHEQVDSIMPG